MWWRKKSAPPTFTAIRCSFSNKFQGDVLKLIAGPRVFICDECVEVCSDIIADDNRFEKQSGKKHSASTGDSAIPCATG